MSNWQEDKAERNRQALERLSSSFRVRAGTGTQPPVSFLLRPWFMHRSEKGSISLRGDREPRDVRMVG